MRWVIGTFILFAIVGIFLFSRDPEPLITKEEVVGTEIQTATDTNPTNETTHITRGILEKATDTHVRPVFSALEIRSFVPERGGFTFPAPYNTRVARITNALDCNNTDCVNYVGYSFWRNMNNHLGNDEILIFIGLKHEYGGPTLYSFNKNTFEVRKVGPLFDSSSPYSWSSADGWYWSAQDPKILYVWLAVDTKLSRYNVETKTLKTVFDIRNRKDLFGEDAYVWQLHSSNDDQIHSATIKENKSYQSLGCMVYSERTGEFQYFKIHGEAFDECQIDKSGRFLVIKEKIDHESEYDNRIIDLSTNPPREKLLLDKDGAGGHSDLGFGVMVAADNFNKLPNAIRLWNLNDLNSSKTVYYDPEWLPGSATHISFANARKDVPIGEQYACASSSHMKNAPRANEIICFKLDGSLQTLVVAPVMTDMQTQRDKDEYAKMPKGNLDVTGQYFLWTTNLSGDRFDAFIVEVPDERFGD